MAKGSSNSTLQLLGTVLLCALVGIFACHSARAEIISFGSEANLFTMEFVPIGNPGNAADTTGSPNPAGSVGYSFNMGKFEVSRDMITKANNLGGLGITLQDMYSYGGNFDQRPATGVSWYEAAKFVNWLNTSQGFQAAYNFDGGGNFQLWSNSEAWQLDGENLFRHKDAQYWLPSTDEWYKAAYYDSTTETYFDYTTGSNTAPTAVASGDESGEAVYGQLLATGPANITLSGGLSPYGTMGQGGNVKEWEETAYDSLNDMVAEDRAYRGGAWGSSFDATDLLASNREQFAPNSANLAVGFRVASADAVSAPEPSSLALLGLLGLYGFWRVRRRR